MELSKNHEGKFLLDSYLARHTVYECYWSIKRHLKAVFAEWEYWEDYNKR